MKDELFDLRMNKVLGALEVSVEKIQNHETRISRIENTMICDSRKRANISKRVRQRAKSISGSMEQPDYKIKFRSNISRLWHDYWDTFGVTTYLDTPDSLYDTVLDWIDSWKPRVMDQEKSA